MCHQRICIFGCGCEATQFRGELCKERKKTGTCELIKHPSTSKRGRCPKCKGDRGGGGQGGRRRQAGSNSGPGPGPGPGPGGDGLPPSYEDAQGRGDSASAAGTMGNRGGYDDPRSASSLGDNESMAGGHGRRGPPTQARRPRHGEDDDDFDDDDDDPDGGLGNRFAGRMRIGDDDNRDGNPGRSGGRRRQRRRGRDHGYDDDDLDDDYAGAAQYGDDDMTRGTAGRSGGRRRAPGRESNREENDVIPVPAVTTVVTVTPT